MVFGCHFAADYITGQWSGALFMGIKAESNVDRLLKMCKVEVESGRT